jgi:acyl-coenzyme A thioesterase 13
VESLVTRYNKVMPTTNFDFPFTKTIQVVSPVADTASNSTGKAMFFCQIPVEYINNPDSGREIHGGAMAMVFDNTTSAALLASRRYSGQGVTRNINVTYFRPLREGDRIIIEAEVVQIGKRLATIQGVMKRRDDGGVLAMCLHEKINPENGGTRVFSL